MKDIYIFFLSAVIIFGSSLYNTSYAIDSDDLFKSFRVDSTNRYMQSPYFDQSTEPHQITFLNLGMSSLQARLDLIESATETIEVEYFIYEADIVGRILAQALMARAREGIRVRILLDTFISANHIDPFIAYEMEQAGIEIRFYNTVPLVRVYNAQFRNHRKLMVADDRYAITGGRNIKDEYYDLSSSYNFVDRDILVEGPIVKTIRKSFDEYWNSLYVGTFARPEMPTRSDLRYRNNSRSNRHGNTADFHRDLRAWHNKVANARDFLTENDNDRALLDLVYFQTRSQMKSLPTGTCEEITYVSDVPGVGAWIKEETYRRTSDLVYQAIEKTQDRFMLESPYFIFNPQSYSAFKDAINRGVEIDVLTNSLHSTDAIYVSAAFFGNVRPWIERGLNAHIFEGRSLPEHEVNGVSRDARWGVHSKSMVFDDDFFMVGTWNFDPRSKDWNSEMAIFCRDEYLASVLEDSITKRINQSIHLDSMDKVRNYEFYQTGMLKRAAYYLLYLPSNWLDFLL